MKAKDLQVGQSCEIRGLTYTRTSADENCYVPLHMNGNRNGPIFHVNADTEVIGKELSPMNVLLVYGEIGRNRTRIYVFKAGEIDRQTYNLLVRCHGQRANQFGTNTECQMKVNFEEVHHFLLGRHGVIFDSDQPCGVMQALGDSVVVAMTGFVLE